jgi:hypothetical protein
LRATLYGHPSGNAAFALRLCFCVAQPRNGCAEAGLYAAKEMPQKKAKTIDSNVDAPACVFRAKHRTADCRMASRGRKVFKMYEHMKICRRRGLNAKPR